MKKDEILKKLEELKKVLDMNQVIIISGASLVLQNIIEETNDIDLSCSTEYYALINWDKKIGAYKKEIKYRSCYEIANNLYYPKDTIIIDGYQCLNLKKCLEIKKELNREKDQKIIEKLESMLQIEN